MTAQHHILPAVRALVIAAASCFFEDILCRGRADARHTELTDA